ncbi:hypothetical protein TNCV_538831 [Trichonephila clavipes]|nr:hypothetical protein TNCV_538831 [Trichonephila clavipes]
MLFKFRCPRTHVTPCVVHSTDKRTGFSQTPIEAFEGFSVRQEPRKKSFPVLSPALHGIPILNDVNEMDIGHFLISIPTAVKTENTMNADNQSFYSSLHPYIQLATCR